MIILRDKEFSKKKKELSKEDKEKLKKQQIKGLVGSGMVYTGINTIDPTVEILKEGINSGEGELTGRVTRFHNTLSDKAEQIMKEGLDGKKTLDPNSYTNKVLDGAATKDGRPLVYTAKDKMTADMIGQSRMITGNAKDAGRTLEINIPYDDIKNRRVLDNPEQLGLSEEKYVKEIKKKTYEKLKARGLSEETAKAAANSPMTDAQIRANYQAVDAKFGPTRIYEGKIAPEYIKGSKVYRANSLKEWGNYVKNNPGRFIKGAQKYVLPVAGTAVLLGGGSALIANAVKNSNKITKGNDSIKK